MYVALLAQSLHILNTKSWWLSDNVTEIRCWSSCPHPQLHRTAQAVREERISEVAWSQRSTKSRKVLPQRTLENSLLEDGDIIGSCKGKPAHWIL